MIDSIEEAIAIELARKGELIIGEIIQHYVGPDAGKSILYFGVGEEKEKDFDRYAEYRLAVLAPGQDYQLGQKFSKLPREFKLIKNSFPMTLDRNY